MKMKILPILILIMVASISVEASNINQQLYDAAGELNVDKVKTLLDSGADPNWLDASESLHPSILDRVSQKRSHREKAQNKQTEIATLLFENGAKLGPHDKDILYVPITCDAYDLTKLLIKHDANPTKFDAYDITPVELAAERGHLDIKELLVKNGAEDLDTKTVIQLQFIENASHASVPELEKLIEKGAKVNVKNRQGETALINSLDCSTSIRFSGRVPVFFYLLDLGADVNLHGTEKFWDWDTTPLHVATQETSSTLDKNSKSGAKEISKKILDSLIKAGAHVSSRDEFGRTPLHTAARHNNIYAAQLLLKHNAKVMPRDRLGKTPLHIAAKHDNIYVAQLLLKHNAKVMPRDGKGKTPLNYAESGDMIKLLKDNGAKEF